MFNKLFGKANKNKSETWVSPLSGQVIPIEDVPDDMFAEKMLGDGIAINPFDGQVVSPVEGEIVQVFPTKHAIGIRSKNGIEILIHIGLETVKLKGKHFEEHIKAGDHVQPGDPLITFDYEEVKKKAKSVITPVIITDSTHVSNLETEKEIQVVSGKTEVVRYDVE